PRDDRGRGEDARARRAPPALGGGPCRPAGTEDDGRGRGAATERQPGAGPRLGRRVGRGGLGKLAGPRRRGRHLPVGRIASEPGVQPLSRGPAPRRLRGPEGPAGPAGPHPVQTYSAARSDAQPETALTSRNSSIPQCPPSRARPLALTPPKGEPAPRDLPVISTMPDLSLSAQRSRRAASPFCTQLVRPQGVSLPILTASSSPSNAMIESTGPKISSRSMAMPGVTSAKTVGRTK